MGRDDLPARPASSAVVPGHRLDGIARVAQLGDRALELVRAAPGDRQPVALLAQHVGDGQPDAAGGPRHDRRSVRHVRRSRRSFVFAGIQPARSIVRRAMGIRRARDARPRGAARGGGARLRERQELRLGQRRRDEEAGRRAAVRVPTIARRVELLRGLDFKHVPKPRTVTAAQARREGLADIDRSYPPRARHADEETLKLLGLLPAARRPAQDRRLGLRRAGRRLLRPAHQTALGRQGLARHSPPRSRSRTSSTTPSRTRRTASRSPASGTDDGATADSALVEGTATALMVDYANRFRTHVHSLGDALDSLGSAELADQAAALRPGLAGIPLPRRPALRDRAAPAGRQRVEARQPGAQGPPPDDDRADHAPGQVAGPRGARCRSRSPRAPVLGPRGYVRRARGELGEWDTRELLLTSLDPTAAGDAAAGWGGGRYELWERRRPRKGCTAPCRPDDALVLGLALGHAGRRPGVRHGADRLASRAPQGPSRGRRPLADRPRRRLPPRRSARHVAGLRVHPELAARLAGTASR